MKSLLLVLVVSQDSETRTSLRAVLESAGHRVIESSESSRVVALLGNGLDPDLLVCDAPDTSYLRPFLAHITPRRVCLVAPPSDRNLRDQASLAGIELFLNKPFTRANFEAILEEIIRPGNQTAPDAAPVSLDALQSAACTGARNDAPQIADAMAAIPYIEELDDTDYFLAASPKMLEIHRQVKLLADIDVNVLILGESGTGKEIIAKLIHKNSRRSREKFLKVNCAALPTDLLESELFGHRRGAFTGAINDRAGKFEQAHRGTLLLDEIGEIGVQMQAKLLHVLQDGQFARLGAQETTKVDVRVLAATNIQLESALLEKKFREDLYYRLSVFTIKVPPLRERRDEIPYLIEQVIRRAPAEMTRGFGNRLPSRLMDVAQLYDWHGNLRELRNFVTRTIVMRDPDAAARELEARVSDSAMQIPQSNAEDASLCVGIRSVVRDIKDRTEVQMIQNALDTFGWNRRRAAQYLNISYRGLLYKIQQHRLRPCPADSRTSRQAARSARQNAV